MNESRRLPMDGILSAMPAPKWIDVLQCWPFQPVEYAIPEGAARIIATAAVPFMARPNAAPVIPQSPENAAHMLHTLDGRGGVVDQRVDWLTDGLQSVVFLALPVTGSVHRQVAISISCYGEN